jgi:ABC-type lipoprotein release transport system permease subunit
MGTMGLAGARQTRSSSTMLARLCPRTLAFKTSSRMSVTESDRKSAVYAGVAALFAGVATFACLVPSWRASRIDPVVALQSN